MEKAAVGLPGIPSNFNQISPHIYLRTLNRISKMKVILLLSALAASAYAQYWVINIIVSTRLGLANRRAELRSARFVSRVWRLQIQ
jgi:hypothetical protein